MLRKRMFETIIDIDKEDKIRREMLRMETEINRVTKFIRVKEALDSSKQITSKSSKDDSIDKEVACIKPNQLMPSSSKEVASSNNNNNSNNSNNNSYCWTKRSAHYKALLMVRRASAESRCSQRLASLKKFKWPDGSSRANIFDPTNSSYYVNDEKENHETCREFCFITIGSLILSFVISFLFFYFFKDYDGLLTGILFL